MRVYALTCVPFSLLFFEYALHTGNDRKLIPVYVSVDIRLHEMELLLKASEQQVACCSKLLQVHPGGWPNTVH